MLNRKSTVLGILILLVAGLFIKSSLNAKDSPKEKFCLVFDNLNDAKLALGSSKATSLQKLSFKDDGSPLLSLLEEKKMESQPLKQTADQNSTAVAKETIVLMETDKGDFKIKLYMEDAPITAGNFKDLVERKFYNGLTFHRIIPGFVVQGGCPLGNGTGNFVDPETKQTRYIKHEFNPKLSHNKAGIVAMARTSNPNSASSQFFIDLAPLASLNPGGVDPNGYAIFGEVIEGMDVVNKIVTDNVAPYPGSDGTANPVKIKSARVL
jgi:cyclophilin family peptidyl-prolyl cis-trans isomerase